MLKIDIKSGKYFLIAFALGMALLNHAPVWAQAFAPPPPPAESPAGVRGIYNPRQVPQSPASAPIAQESPQQEAANHVVPPQPELAPTTPLVGAQSLDEGRIIARVDGQIVLASDLLWQVNKLIELNRSRIPPDQIDRAREALLRQNLMGMIDSKIIYADFRRQVPAESIPSILKNLEEPFQESEIPRLAKMLKVKDQFELDNFFAENGTSLKDVQEQFIQRTIAGEWLRQLSPKPEPVSHEAMLTYYKDNLEKYEFPAQVKWEEVMTRFNRHGGDRNSTYRACAEMGNEICLKVSQNPQFRGSAFEEIAKAKSHGHTSNNGGQHDWTTKGALRCEEINSALFSLKIGQMSNIIESDDGFHIVRVLERKDAGRTPFTEAQGKIRKLLKNKRQQELIEEELVKLREKSRVWTLFDGHISGAELSEILAKGNRR